MWPDVWSVVRWKLFNWKNCEWLIEYYKKPSKISSSYSMCWCFECIIATFITFVCCFWGGPVCLTCSTSVIWDCNPSCEYSFTAVCWFAICTPSSLGLVLLSFIKAPRGVLEDRCCCCCVSSFNTHHQSISPLSPPVYATECYRGISSALQASCNQDQSARWHHNIPRSVGQTREMKIGGVERKKKKNLSFLIWVRRGGSLGHIFA